MDVGWGGGGALHLEYKMPSSNVSYSFSFMLSASALGSSRIKQAAKSHLAPYSAVPTCAHVHRQATRRILSNGVWHIFKAENNYWQVLLLV